MQKHPILPLDKILDDPDADNQNKKLNTSCICSEFWILCNVISNDIGLNIECINHQIKSNIFELENCWKKTATSPLTLGNRGGCLTVLLLEQKLIN